jgi:hypothetical protein
MVVVLLTLVLSCSLVLAAPYSTDKNTRHVEICVDLTKAWYNAVEVGATQKADYIHEFIDKYNNHLVSDNDAIAVIQKAKE